MDLNGVQTVQDIHLEPRHFRSVKAPHGGPIPYLLGCCIMGNRQGSDAEPEVLVIQREPAIARLVGREGDEALSLFLAHEQACGHHMLNVLRSARKWLGADV